MIDLQKAAESAANLAELCGMLHGHITRSYPVSGTPGSQGRQAGNCLRQLLPENGTYVDIGASDPVECSNTFRLYEKGWRGLLIEPLPLYWPHILRAREGDFLCPSAVRNYTGKTIMRVQGSVSSVLPGWNINETSQIILDCERGQEILDRFPAIRDACEFCSIDVEGVEGEVIESIDWDRFHPLVVCVEYRSYHPTEPGVDMSAAWQPILEQHQYTVAFQDELNKVFCQRR